MAVLVGLLCGGAAAQPAMFPPPPIAMPIAAAGGWRAEETRQPAPPHGLMHCTLERSLPGSRLFFFATAARVQLHVVVGSWSLSPDLRGHADVAAGDWGRTLAVAGARGTALVLDIDRHDLAGLLAAMPLAETIAVDLPGQAAVRIGTAAGGPAFAAFAACARFGARARE